LEGARDAASTEALPPPSLELGAITPVWAVPPRAARRCVLRYSAAVPAPDRRRFLIACAALAACRAKPELPSLGTLSEFALTDQDGRRLGSAELRGRVWVAAFMFTRCPTICPRITRRMRELQIQAADRKLGLTLVSFSVDPENDTPEVLRAYAQKYGVDPASWRFLTGDLEVVRKTAVDGVKMALDGKADPSKPDYGILHGTYLVLIDRELRLRGYYRTESAEDTTRLLDDAASL
jgi:protein SCO1/2